MDLYLVRHAIAFERDPWRWPDDGDRPLTKQGAARFRVAAAGIRQLAPDVDRVLSSPLVRAWQTAEILHDVTGWPEPVRCDPLTPGQAPEEVVAALTGLPEARSIALVGHEPNLSQLAAYLLTGGEGELDLIMKKGGMACLRFGGGVVPGGAGLRFWLTPAVLRAVART